MAKRSATPRKTPTNKGSASGTQTPIALPKGALGGLAPSKVALARDAAARGDAAAVTKALRAAKGQRTRQRNVADVRRAEAIIEAAPINDRLVAEMLAIAQRVNKRTTEFELLGNVEALRAIAQLPPTEKRRRIFTGASSGKKVTGRRAIMELFGVLHMTQYSSRFYFKTIR